MLHHPRRFNPVPLALAVALALSAPALAQAQAVDNGKAMALSIATQPLGSALNELAAATGAPIAFSPALVADKTAPSVKGTLTVNQAVNRLLAGSGLVAVKEGATFIIKRGSAPAAAQEVSTLPAVTVTASADSEELPRAYAGGQVGRGGRLGLLGNKDVMDTPFNITSYTAELNENQQAVTVADVVANDPSVRTRTHGLTSAAGAGDSFMIRGFTVQNAVLFDGIAGVAPERTFHVETAERIEVLKGPNALLHGMAPDGSAGGAINIAPKRATDKPLTRFTTTYESDGVFGGHLDIGRRFGEDNQWGVRFNGIYRNGDTATDAQSLELGTAAIGVDYQGSDVRTSLDVGHQTQNIDAPNGAAGIRFPGALAIPDAPDGSRQFAQDWEFSKSKSDYLLAKLEYDIAADWTLYGAAGGSENRNEYLSTDISVKDASGDATATVYYYPGFSKYKTFQGGLRGSFHTGSVKHQVNFNASYLEKDLGWAYYSGPAIGLAPISTNFYNPSFAPAPSSIAGFSSRPPKTNSIELPTVALSDTVSLLDDRVAVTLGVRRQSVKTTSYSASGVATPGYDKSAVTPMLAVVFKPQSNLSIYGNYIEGLSEGKTAPAGTTNVGQIFPPIKTKQYEAGVKYDFGRFATTASLFQIQRPSELTILNPDTTLTYTMDGEQRNRGVEINVFGEAAQGVRLLGGIAYTDAKLTKTNGGTNDGKTAMSVPRWQLNLGGEYDLAAAPGTTLWARVISTDSQYLDAANTRSIPGWTRWDIGARYKTTASGRPLVLRAGIQNLFDRNYWTAASGDWLKVGSPRTLTLSASMDF